MSYSDPSNEDPAPGLLIGSGGTSHVPRPWQSRRRWLRVTGGAALAAAGLMGAERGGATQVPPDFVPWKMALRRRRDGREVLAEVRSVRGHPIDARIDGRAFGLDARELDASSQERINFLQIRGRVVPLELSREQEAEISEEGLRAMRYVRRQAKRELPFLLYEPPEAREGRVELPLVVFLHGNGGRGDDGYMNYADAGKAPRHFIDEAFQQFLPSFVYIPQSAEEGSLWSNTSIFRPRETLLRALQCIDVLKARYGYAIDMKRLYITGLSSGGTGCYEAIAKFPGKFAAAVPIACNHDPVVFYRANATPVWYFVNERDPSIYFPHVTDLSKHFRSLGSEHRVTMLAGGGHNAWTEAYGNQDFRAWLKRRELSQELYPTDYRTWIDEEDQERDEHEAKPRVAG
jgi:dienelactone hydrolase